MTLYEKIIELAANQGIAIAVSVVVILLLLVFGRSLLKQYEEQKKLDRENFKAEKEIERQERKEDRQAQREQTKSLIDLHSQTNEAILKFTAALKNSDSLLDKHNICAEENFGELKSDVKDIIGRLDIVQDTTKELATKAMLEEVKQEILRIKRD